MGVITTYTEEITSPVAAARLFRAIFTDAQSTMPKIMPQYIKSVELEAAAGDAVNGGCITKTTLYHQDSPIRHKIDSFDSKNLACKYTLIQGGMLINIDKLESVSYFVRFEPALDAINGGGCVIKATCEYNTKGSDVVVKEEDIKECKAMARAVTKAVGDYLLKNPSVCV